MWKATLVAVSILAVTGLSSAQDLIFADDFEWGSICAWANLWYVDADGDGWGETGTAGIPVTCPPPGGYAPNQGDCDDISPFINPGEPELCDLIDNDCDINTGDGTGEPWFGDPCDGFDTDLCDEGIFLCTDSTQVCSDESDDNMETCNTIDDDCNPATPDGSDEPWYGGSCDGADSDLCLDETLICLDAVQVCEDNPDDFLDTCDGVDNDCDPLSDDGSEDPLNGVPCDGADSDLCDEGTNSCTGGALICSDNTTSDLDICDGFDNDCDPGSDDGSEDPFNGAPCDGSDSDLCNEGTNSCSGGALICSDTTDNDLDLCDGVDNDCDPASADGSEDPLYGVPCDGPDSDLCLEGISICVGGAFACNDTSDDTTEECNGLDDDCDGSIDEDFDRDNNPSCATHIHLGTINGDTFSPTLYRSHYSEEWIRITIREDDEIHDQELTARITLVSPPGVDFDLYVYCESCGGSLAGSSIYPGAGTDTVYVRRDDTAGHDDEFDILVRILHIYSSICAYWHLEILGNSGAPFDYETCPWDPGAGPIP